ncbi:MAG TPA: DUF2017 domain-containing protein [Sporichthyaceae bacterium]
MSGRIKRERGGSVVITLAPGEAEVIRGAFGDLLELFDSHAAATSPAQEIAPGLRDPFGSPGSDVPPDDPALARLLPDAYPDDPAAAAEYRRFTENDLMAGKRANIAVLLAGLDQIGPDGRLQVPAARVPAWLVALNDLRLTLGTRLEIEEDYEAAIAALADDDPRLPAYALYEWLTWLQDSLIRTQR